MCAAPAAAADGGWAPDHDLLLPLLDRCWRALDGTRTSAGEAMQQQFRSVTLRQS
jgi:hypothetical protein